MGKEDMKIDIVRTTKELGELVRRHRKKKNLTQEMISGLGNLSVRFISEFERGKETAEVGKVLKALQTLGLEVVIQPRRPVKSRSLSRSIGNEDG